MFGIESSELAVIAVVALLVIGPKDLPRVMRMVGTWMAKGRAMTRHVRAGFDTMMREAELEEMQKVWAQQNDAIMKATSLPDLSIAGPIDPMTDDWMMPGPDPQPETTPEAPLDPEPPRPARTVALAKPEAPAPKPEAPAPKPRRVRAKSEAAPGAVPTKRAPRARKPAATAPASEP